jgi:hypothetical protein
MNKKTKVLIFIGASIATSFAFIIPFLLNQGRYNAYLFERGEEYLKKVEGKGPPSSWSAEDLLEQGDMNIQDYNMELCLKRYKDGNHPFATALTACKQEVLMDQSR